MLIPEKYLRIDLSVCLKMSIAKFRCSNHEFNIELGRHLGVERHNRLDNLRRQNCDILCALSTFSIISRSLSTFSIISRSSSVCARVCLDVLYPFLVGALHKGLRSKTREAEPTLCPTFKTRLGYYRRMLSRWCSRSQRDKFDEDKHTEQWTSFYYGTM